MYITLETDRLVIRPIDLRDAEFIIDLVNSEGWLRFIGDRQISNSDDARKYIQKILDNKSYYYNVIELKESAKAIGIVTFLKREDEKYPDIGFALLPEFEGKGYAMEASKSYLDIIEGSGKYANIIGITLAENKKSINLLGKLGLHYMGNQKKGEDILSYFSLKNEKFAGQ